MLFKPVYEPVELKLLRFLNSRMNLTTKEKQYFFNLEKGYEGERKLAALLEHLSIDLIILNDLLLEHNNSIFQIDTLLISQNIIYLFEVKNYKGDFYIDADIWYKKSGNEIKNPLLQLKRSESLLRQLLKDFKLNLSIEAYVIFINPEFTLYKAPLTLPILLPTQLNSFIKNLNRSSSNLTAKHANIAEQLVSKHITETPYTKLPKYDYHQLQKGITCAKCSSFLNSFNDWQLECTGCGYQEVIESAVLRSIEQFQLLFPDRKITTNSIHEWCKIIVSKKKIRNILKKNFTLLGHGKDSYYVKHQ